ncbi:MAG: C4-type zinc ribbon domain-containing protein [Chloroflexota bacterium]|nr:C4-type zinc ribbon domain-containing protein [Chloroflexota bacterium]
MADIAKMYELQKIDVTWEKVRRRLGQLKAGLVESDELQAARQSVAAIEAELQHCHAQQKDAELKAQSLTERMKATEQRLTSGEIHNSKELAALQASLEALQRQHATVESGGVEALLQAEELTNQLAGTRAGLKAVESQWTTAQSTLLDEETKLKRAYLQLKKQRELSAAGLDAAVLSRYETLRQRKGGIAVAQVQNTICGACHVQVPTGIVSAARNHTTDVVVCPSCGRILYAG